MAEAVLNKSPWFGFTFKPSPMDVVRCCDSCGQPIEDDVELCPVCPLCKEHWDAERNDQCLSHRGGKYFCSLCNLKFVRVELNGKIGFVSR